MRAPTALLVNKLAVVVAYGCVRDGTGSGVLTR